MSWQNFPQPVGMLAAIVSPTLVTFSGLPPQPIAPSNPEGKIMLQFPSPEDVEILPRNGVGVAQSVSQNRVLVTPLLPNSGFGMTVAANPTLFVYVPRSRVQEAEFSVSDEQGNDVYRATFALTATPGIVRLSLPATVSLAIGKNYQWQFTFIFDSIDRSNDVAVGGRLQRTELSPELKAKLENASDPLEQAKLYAKALIWHETLTILASLRGSNPAEWEGLLKSVGLGYIANKPFVECCRIQN